MFFDALSEAFRISSGVLEKSVQESRALPSWMNQFTSLDIQVLFRSCLKTNSLKHASFFMQLIWSIDKDSMPASTIYDTFIKQQDYKSALSVFAADGKFDSERSAYHFLATNQTSLAEPSIMAMISQNNRGFETLYLQNHEAVMDAGSLKQKYDLFCRSSPEKMESFSLILNKSRLIIDCPSFSAKLIYETENQSGGKQVNASKKQWTNTELLQEAKLLRRRKQFENSYYMLSKMDIAQDPVWSFKYYFELAKWFHSTGKFNVAIEAFSSLAKGQQNKNLLVKVIIF